MGSEKFDYVRRYIRDFEGNVVRREVVDDDGVVFYIDNAGRAVDEFGVDLEKRGYGDIDDSTYDSDESDES
jgi:hypothetical protein